MDKLIKKFHIIREKIPVISTDCHVMTFGVFTFLAIQTIVKIVCVKIFHIFGGR